jgi:hypothetical protein
MIGKHFNGGDITRHYDTRNLESRAGFLGCWMKHSLLQGSGRGARVGRDTSSFGNKRAN